jgi:H+/Cl- antiporter ClcA
MKPFTFIFINFCVSFFSDIVLNDLSRSNIKLFQSLKTLKPYFDNQSIIKCAFNAGITVLVALLINMFLSYFLLGFFVPTNFIQLAYFCILAFGIGYIFDVFIYKFNIFNGLTDYYKTFGAGLWGAIAFIFSIVISFFIQRYILVRL